MRDIELCLVQRIKKKVIWQVEGEKFIILKRWAQGSLRDMRSLFDADERDGDVIYIALVRKNYADGTKPLISLFIMYYDTGRRPPFQVMEFDGKKTKKLIKALKLVHDHVLVEVL